MGVGETHPTKVGQGVGLDPDDIIQYPVVQIQHDTAQPEDIVVSADHLDGASIFQYSAAGGKPEVTEGIILWEATELVPGIIYRVHFGHVGTPQFLAELQVLRRVSEDQVN